MEEEEVKEVVRPEEDEEEEYVSKNKLKKMTKQGKKQPKNVISSGTTLKEQFSKLSSEEQDELY